MGIMSYLLDLTGPDPEAVAREFAVVEGSWRTGWRHGYSLQPGGSALAQGAPLRRWPLEADKFTDAMEAARQHGLVELLAPSTPADSAGNAEKSAPVVLEHHRSGRTHTDWN